MRRPKLKIPRMTLPARHPDLLLNVPPELSSVAEVIVDDQTLLINESELEVLSSIDRGRFGQVKKMRHTPSGKIFAAKLIDPCKQGVQRRELRAELEISKNTSCPCVVPCYGGLLQNDWLLILMELMDTSLHKLRLQVYPENRIPEPILVYIIQRVLTGLEYLHSMKRIMHRDVKPHNVLVNRQGLVKVCDFGISKELVNSLTSSNVGTARYSAPERCVNTDRGVFDIRTDVWSLGVSLWELATGETCYGEYNDDELMISRAIVDQPAPSLPENAGHSQELQHIVSRCLQKRVLDRPKFVELLKTPPIDTVDVNEGERLLREFLIPYLP